MIQCLMDILYEGAAAGDEAVLKQIWLARKKVYFFTVFSNEFSDDLSLLSKVVDIEYGMNTSPSMYMLEMIIQEYISIMYSCIILLCACNSTVMQAVTW